MTMNEQTERHCFISAECRDGRHGVHCSRNPRSPAASMGGPVCACACHDTQQQQKLPVGIPCPHCQQTMLLISCDDCSGHGGWWVAAPEPEGWRWRVCSTCHDTGQRWKCLDFMTCPGTRWYPLDARSAASLAAAKGGA